MPIRLAATPQPRNCFRRSVKRRSHPANVVRIRSTVGNTEKLRQWMSEGWISAPPNASVIGAQLAAPIGSFADSFQEFGEADAGNLGGLR
jgi:hypothetical protein